MRIKAKPDDFAVEEVIHFTPSKKEGPFRVYKLEKSGWNTSDAIRDAAAKKKVPFKEIRTLGKKDRHALTAGVKDIPSVLPVFPQNTLNLRCSRGTVFPLSSGIWGSGKPD